MNTAQYNHLFSFIWNIANDVLVHAFEKGEYKKIIMPMTVLRRLDILLEPTKDAVLERKAQLDAANISNQEPVLFQVTGYPFCNTSRFTMKKLKAEVDPKRLKMNFIEYLNGYSKDVQDIIDKFRLRQQVDNLTDAERLGSIIDKFTDSSINLSIKPVMDDKGREILPALDNHMMGTLFEELLRKFNEENNVTEAGEHFTPRDYVKLLADLAIIPIADQIEDNTYSIYDGACGTGGILTISEEEMKRLAKERGRKININIFGQELQPETFATCKADLMISGERRAFDYILNGSSRQYIAFGSTISEDGHKGETYDFCISNPPFGTPWKEDLKKWGLAESEKKKISDPRFRFEYKGNIDFNVIPEISDPQMLFLANNISRMKHGTKLGTRIVEVHNGSSLFTGDAGGGESNLRRYIIENDMLEAIIAMPENDFYNTSIGTFIWVITNRKAKERKGKVQLIDATSIKTTLTKNLGKKNCETSDKQRKYIVDLLMSFVENEHSKIFTNEEFGYWDVPILHPQVDDNGHVMKDKKGAIKYKKDKYSAQIPLCYPGGIEEFYNKEILPYDSSAKLGDPVIGYEIRFAKYFYNIKALTSCDALKESIASAQRSIDSYIGAIVKTGHEVNSSNAAKASSLKSFKPCKNVFFGDIPSHWKEIPLKYCFTERSQKGFPNEPILCATQSRGVIPQSMYENRVVTVNKDFENLKLVKEGDFVISLRSFQGGIEYAYYQGIISAAYTVLTPNDPEYTPYFKYLFKSIPFIHLLKTCVTGIREGQNINYSLLGNKYIPIPPKEEIKDVVARISAQNIEQLCALLDEQIKSLNEYKQRFVSDIIRGRD